MSYTIKFETNRKNVTIDPIVDKIRDVAQRDGWAGSAGFIQWAKENYNADLFGGAGLFSSWISISFETQADMARFKVDFEVNDQARQLRLEQQAQGPIVNKQILKLAEQVGMTTDDGDLLPGETYMLLDEDIEKFAKLIVKEMLQTCEDHPAWTGRMIGEQFKQHFGVE